MALKRKASTSKGEQFYMLEVFVGQVDLDPERTTVVNVEDLIIRVRFADLPEYEISIPKNDQIDRKNCDPTGCSGNFKFGRSCLFANTPSGLIESIKGTPMLMDVYRKGSTASTKESEALLGTAKISLPACMCNRVSAARNETDGLSAPCVVKDSFDLTDSDGNGTGTVSVVLRLSCFGSSIVKHFSLNEKSFVLEDSPLQKFPCPYLAPESVNGEDDSKDGNPSLTRPSSPPRVSMDDPAFNDLTAAEKLNDPKYRELVYRAYPDEPTCSCLPTDRSTHPMECASGCKRRCCMKLRDPSALDAEKGRNVEDTMANTYCANDFLSALFTLKGDSPPCNRPRLRGGGDIEQIYIGPPGYRWTDYEADYTWHDERSGMENRLEGGGEIEMSSCSCSGGPVSVPLRKSSGKESDVIKIFDACMPRVTSTGPKPGCACPGKIAPAWPRGAAKCSKSPCMGIDCLIRAFNDAQEFVDSIGKVPGLQGLGLMDPAESPYFGRDIDKDYVTVPEPQEPKKRAPPGAPHVPGKPPCPAPCNVQGGKQFDDAHQHAPAAHAPVGFTIPAPRLGIVREAIPVLPKASSTTGPHRHRKKEEKKEDKGEKLKDLDPAITAMDTELGPCGEPKCKSRRKRPAEDSSATQIEASDSAKAKTDRSARGPKKQRGTKGGRKSQTARGGPGGSSAAARHRGGGASSPHSGKGGHQPGKVSPGPGGDRSRFSRPSIIVNRRVMKYVYYVGDAYPGINYGHKDCIDLRMRVPANMGWLWNTMAIAGNLKPRIGWRPGAIGRALNEMLQEAKENSIALMETSSTSADKRGTDRGSYRNQERSTGRGTGRSGGRSAERSMERSTDRGRTANERAKSAPSRAKHGAKKRGGKTASFPSRQRTQSKMEGEEDGPEAPPTLHIHRKDGTYYVTMYPIRSETSDEPRLAEPMKPLQFKIVKNKDDASVATSSTASDMEIEFSPPAAVTRYRKKPDVVHVDTQVRQQEILDAYKVDPSKRDKKGKKDKKEKDRNEKKKGPGDEREGAFRSRQSQSKK